MTPQPTFAFIPGGSSNAQAWGPLQNELALLGHRSYAIDLPGHGSSADRPAEYHRSPQDLKALAVAPSPMKGISLDDNVRHVVGIVSRLAAHGPVVLVANSFGGITLSAVGNAVPELLHRIVYISAACPTGFTTPDEELHPAEHDGNLLDAAVAKIAVGDIAAQGFARFNWRAAHGDPALFAELKAAVMADGTDAQYRALLDGMDPDESYDVLGPDSVIRADRWGRVPHTYLRLTEDRSIPLHVQDRMIEEADQVTPDNPFDVRSLAASHVGYFSRPREFAEILAGLR
ncbi:alpha/beta hydrolase [Streptomyces sp. NBC_01381]|uniref:alpha/beta fold hydrolase n=1 Tax=Streptomyces sp. NBC_01381 TaxID=2903845 RepID=UPI0022533948|nr:alpha/beta hydrolase [Streptomyces sp. NBC_01381]MCX4670199.1 alpha/beta hydrolase [Streptomyces sp. NBC_01381]